MKDRALSEQLSKIVGADGLVDDPDELLVYECDAYTLEKNPPTAVVFPRTTEQVAAVAKLCASRNVPIIPRGSGHQLKRLSSCTWRWSHDRVNADESCAVG